MNPEEFKLLVDQMDSEGGVSPITSEEIPEDVGPAVVPRMFTDCEADCPHERERPSLLAALLKLCERK